MENRNKKFPESYPDNLLDMIIADGASENTFNDVYRVSNCELINRDSFLSSFLEKIRSEDTVNRDAYLAKDMTIDDFSTSFFEKKKDAEKIIVLKIKYENKPILMKGTIIPDLGLSIRTKESKTRNISKKRSKSSHIDWWLYEDADPSYLFEKEKEEL